MQDWSELAVREMPAMSARRRPEELPPLAAPLLAFVEDSLSRPLVGITTEGALRPGLFTLEPTGVPTTPLLEAASAFLGTLSAAQRDQATFAVDADERRTWFNIHPNLFRHGLLIEELTSPQRTAALRLLQATLSARGYQQARDVMRLNELLAEITGRADEYGEWPYFVSFFGTPTPDQPWGWQLDGHHLNLNAFVVGDHLAATPSFMGSEPCSVASGPLAGTRVFEPEERNGLGLVRSLDAGQRAKAILFPSILPGELPPERDRPIDGQMIACAFQDNRVIGYEGVRGDELSDGQRRLLRELVGTYVGWRREDHAAVTMREIDAHLDETHFCWMGGTGPEDPFYYRAHSPVVLVEFNHEAGVVFEHDAPYRHHTHTVVRTPNGGDYGVDLLRQHYERFDHAQGGHIAT
ncbi:MAG: DUF3500 domain-containing protein [Acidimicrobiia bacterium]|nr:DUF3500 domain-containing protein [Acidimicrobiia bacterium]